MAHLYRVGRQELRINIQGYGGINKSETTYRCKSCNKFTKLVIDKCKHCDSKNVLKSVKYTNYKHPSLEELTKCLEKFGIIITDFSTDIIIPYSGF